MYASLARRALQKGAAKEGHAMAIDFTPLSKNVGLAFAIGGFCLGAQAAEIKVIGANPVKDVVLALGAQFERDTGQKVVSKFVTGPVAKQEIDGGTLFDLVIAPTPLVDGLAKEGKLVGVTEMAKIGVALGVRKGTAVPDVSSTEAFKRALLNAKTVAHSAQGDSGVYFLAMLGRLGIAEEMKPKLRPLGGDPLANAVPKGEAEMIFSSMPDILVEGTVSVEPLPSELQQNISFSAGVSSKATEAERAKAFLIFLMSPAAAPIMKAKGIESIISP
jgi:molybdate transport system substrate-binding protein